MFVAGDECGRTQRGNNNAYNRDDEVSWFDWGRAAGFADLEAFATRVLALRAAVDAADGVECFGVDGAPDTSFESRSLAWRVGSLYVMANMWWEPLRFAMQAAGDWSVLVDTADAEAPPRPAAAGSVVEVGPRSIIVLERR
jgi:glycogen operon protein